MNKYFRLIGALFLGALLLGLAGCGSSNNNSCPSGQTMTTAGCGTGSCYVPGTNQQGAIVNNACQPLSNNTVANNSSCQMYGPQFTMQSIPAPFNSYPLFAQTGGQGCCEGGTLCCQPLTNTNGYYQQQGQCMYI